MTCSRLTVTTRSKYDGTQLAGCGGRLGGGERSRGQQLGQRRAVMELQPAVRKSSVRKSGGKNQIEHEKHKV